MSSAESPSVAAVTGGAGQLGTHVLRRLLKDPTIERVLCIDVNPPSLPLGGKLEFVRADVRDADFASILEGVHALFHFAFIVTQKVEPGVYDAVNVDGSRRVFEGAVEAGVKRIVYASSIAAYGVVPGHPEPIVESTPRVFQPEFPYSACKHRVETILDELAEKYPDVAFARCRPAILIGTHFQNPGAKMLGKLLDRGKIASMGEEVPLPLVWDEDVADAAILMAKTGARGPFNLIADDQKTPEQIATMTSLDVVRPPPTLLKALGLLAPALERLGIGEAVDPSWQREGNTRMIVSSRHALETLGWKRSCPTSIDVINRYLETAPGRTDRRVAAFLRFANLTGPEVDGARGPVHLAIEGPGGGDWTIHTDDGRLRARSGLPRPPITTVRLSRRAFSSLLGSNAANLEQVAEIEGAPEGVIAVRALFERPAAYAAKWVIGS